MSWTHSVYRPTYDTEGLNFWSDPRVIWRAWNELLHRKPPTYYSDDGCCSLSSTFRGFFVDKLKRIRLSNTKTANNYDVVVTTGSGHATTRLWCVQIVLHCMSCNILDPLHADVGWDCPADRLAHSCTTVVTSNWNTCTWPLMLRNRRSVTRQRNRLLFFDIRSHRQISVNKDAKVTDCRRR